MHKITTLQTKQAKKERFSFNALPIDFGCSRTKYTENMHKTTSLQTKHTKKVRFSFTENNKKKKQLTVAYKTRLYLYGIY